jgi:hypothetical protein
MFCPCESRYVFNISARLHFGSPRVTAQIVGGSFGDVLKACVLFAFAARACDLRLARGVRELAFNEPMRCMVSVFI